MFPALWTRQELVPHAKLRLSWPSFHEWRTPRDWACCYPKRSLALRSARRGTPDCPSRYACPCLVCWSRAHSFCEREFSRPFPVCPPVISIDANRRALEEIGLCPRLGQRTFFALSTISSAERRCPESPLKAGCQTRDTRSFYPRD